jgi:curli biogenesis system outer membrane secretion channel CsgG
MSRWWSASCMLGLLASSLAGADYVAYSIRDGQPVPLPEKIDGIAAEHLVNIQWGQYGGPRPTVGVLEVKNNTSLSTFLASSTLAGDRLATSIPVNGIEAIVTDALSRSGRFRLVERDQDTFQGVLQEQDLAASGRVSAPSGAATGNILGAALLVQVVITDYQPDASGKDLKVGSLLEDKVPLLGGLNIKKRRGRIGLNVRLISAETSEVTFSTQVEAVITESEVDFGGFGAGDDVALGGFLSRYSQMPIGQAAISAVNEGIYELVKSVGAQPTQGAVIRGDANQVYINLGGNSVRVGERFEVKTQGEELIDPETGLSLGSVDTVTGRVEVVDVQEKFSIARVLEGSAAPERGDRVVSTEAPPALEFASAWSE